ncbi:hypothetical protein AtDm6_0921 [Acetobacter tropicalis]|uniref:Uncharacterized protein n=1 Tax=Acetobacter tropicalis TaxID=104102 RepID=A0A094YTD8_9PROT|nr:hypothetical protein AtDm6_0921 [Acetobacter tropicalis]
MVVPTWATLFCRTQHDFMVVAYYNDDTTRIIYCIRLILSAIN